MVGSPIEGIKAHLGRRNGHKKYNPMGDIEDRKLAGKVSGGLLQYHFLVICPKEGIKEYLNRLNQISEERVSLINVIIRQAPMTQADSRWWYYVSKIS